MLIPVVETWHGLLQHSNMAHSIRSIADTEAFTNIRDMSCHKMTHHSLQHPLWQTFSHTPANKYTHSKSAWINKRWSFALQPHLRQGSLPHQPGSDEARLSVREREKGTLLAYRKAICLFIVLVSCQWLQFIAVSPSWACSFKCHL